MMTDRPTSKTFGRETLTRWTAGLRPAGGLAAVAILAACAAGHPVPGPAPAVGGAACADISFPIYFAENSDQLTEPARQALGAAATQVRRCRIAYVSVIGLTDSAGAANDNLELSKRRASMVAQALAAAGLPAPKFEVRGLGEAGATTRTGQPVPLRRRTDVVIHVTT